MKTLVPMYLTVQMHFICISETFKNALKSTDLIVLLKAVKELKSTMSSGRKFYIIYLQHGLQRMQLQHLYYFFAWNW